MSPSYRLTESEITQASSEDLNYEGNLAAASEAGSAPESSGTAPGSETSTSTTLGRRQGCNSLTGNASDEQTECDVKNEDHKADESTDMSDGRTEHDDKNEDQKVDKTIINNNTENVPQLLRVTNPDPISPENTPIAANRDIGIAPLLPQAPPAVVNDAALPAMPGPAVVPQAAEEPINQHANRANQALPPHEDVEDPVGVEVQAGMEELGRAQEGIRGLAAAIGRNVNNAATDEIVQGIRRAITHFAIGFRRAGVAAENARFHAGRAERITNAARIDATRIQRVIMMQAEQMERLHGDNHELQVQFAGERVVTHLHAREIERLRAALEARRAENGNLQRSLEQLQADVYGYEQ